MSIRVELSYAERILNALSRVERKRSDDVITRMEKDAAAINEIIEPLLSANQNRMIGDLKAEVLRLETVCKNLRSEASTWRKRAENAAAELARLEAVRNER